jgi:tetratricopeptide (TPR) repeat protein
MLVIERLVRFSLFLLIFFSGLLPAQNYPNHTVDFLLKRGIDRILVQDFEDAERNFRMLKEDFPRIPFGDIYLAANEIVKAEFYGNDFNESIISKHLNDASQLSEELYESDQENVWNNYFMALSKGYSAYYEALKGNYISAFTGGYDALDYFNECLEKDSTFYESYIALGTYQYWAGAKTDIINWLPFIPDDKKNGVKLLEEVITRRSYNYHIAVNSLTWIYIEEEEYQKAVETAKPVFEAYPGNKFIGLALASAYRNINPTKSVEVYGRILDALERTGDPNKFNEILIKYKLAKTYLEMDKNQEALIVCNDILSIEQIPKLTLSRMHERLEEIRDIKDKLT